MIKKHKMKNSILLFFLAFITLTSCIKDDVVIENENETVNEDDMDNEDLITGPYDCEFVQVEGTMDGLIDDTERMLMEDCMENSLQSVNRIKSNLIGEWGLVGHGEGWVASVSQPCGHIIINENELTFEFESAYIDTIVTYSWDIETVEWSGGEYYHLKTSPEYVEGLFITQAGEIYFSNTAFSCINNTMNQVFDHTKALHTYVPSFGDWGFVMASRLHSE